MREGLHEDNAIIHEFEIKSDCVEALRAAVALAFMNYQKIEYFSKTKNTLKFYWHQDEREKNKLQELPYVLTAKNGFHFIESWLKSVPPEDRITEYEGGDGSHGFGFIMKSRDDDSYCSFMIKAMNLYYSK